MRTVVAKERVTGKKSGLRSLRLAGRIPANLYGRGRDTRAISLDAAELQDVIRQEGEHALFHLSLDGAQAESVLLQEVQRAPLKGWIRHVDLLRVDLNRPIETEVPLEFVGVEGLEKGGRLLQIQMRELRVRCLPDRRPHRMAVDVSAMQVGDALYVRDLPIPDGVDRLSEEGELVVTVLEVQKPSEPEEPVAAGETERPSAEG